MKGPTFLLAVLLVTLSGAAAGVCEDVMPSSRVSLFCEGVTVHYDQRDEEFARKFSEHIPVLVRQAREEYEKVVADPTAITLQTLKERREEYLSVIAYYLGLRKPSASMRKTFDVVRDALEKQYADMSRDHGKLGMFDTVQIWRKSDLVAELRAHPENDFYELDKDGAPAARNSCSFRVTVHIDGPKKETTAVDVAALGFGDGTRKNAFLSVVINDTGAIVIDQEVSAQLSLATNQMKGWAAFVSSALRDIPPHFVLHETTEVAIVTSLLSSNDRRWFCEGMANFIAYRALVELASPEAARRSYNLSDKLALWKKFENEVNLPAWKIVDDLTVEENSSDLDRARYAYATKAIANVYEKYGREFFPHWCREIARTPRRKANIATVYATFDKLTGEKLSDFYPRPLFSKP